MGPLGEGRTSGMYSVIRCDDYIWAVGSGEAVSQRPLAFEQPTHTSPCGIWFHFFNHMKTKREEICSFVRTVHPPSSWHGSRSSSKRDGKSQNFYGNPPLIILHLGFLVFPSGSGRNKCLLSWLNRGFKVLSPTVEVHDSLLGAPAFFIFYLLLPFQATCPHTLTGRKTRKWIGVLQKL